MNKVKIKSIHTKLLYKKIFCEYKLFFWIYLILKLLFIDFLNFFFLKKYILGVLLHVQPYKPL